MHYGDLRATMSVWRDRGVVSDRDTRKQQEMAAAIGMRRGWWGTEKDLLPCDAALVDQLYDVGPDDTARTKDLVNHRTRRAAGYDYLYTFKTLPVRNQGKCGSDMFSGYRTTCRFVDVMSAGNPKAKYHWRRANYSVKQVDTEELGQVRHIKNDSISIMKATKKFYLKQIEFLQGKYGEAELRESYEAATTNAEKIRWMLENYTEEQWYDLWGYHARTTVSYKGECGWSEEPHPCLHHEGAVQETVPVYWVDSDGNPLRIVTSWYKWNANWKISYPNDTVSDAKMGYLYDLDDPDAFLAEHIEDKYVAAQLSKSAQRCRTESRDWLRSTWYENVTVGKVDDDGKPVMERQYVLEDDGLTKKRDADGNHIMEDSDTQATEVVARPRGVRGHYTLRWWGKITKQRDHDALVAEMQRKDGEEQNGWVFHATGTSGHWKAKNKPQAYRVAIKSVDKWGNPTETLLPFLFDTDQAALAFVKDATPHLNTSYKMADNIAVERLYVKLRFQDYEISQHADPNRFTPQELADLARANQVPEDYMIAKQPFNHGYDIEPIMDIIEYVGAGNIGLPPKKEVAA